MSLCQENKAENASLSQLGTVTTSNNALARMSLSIAPTSSQANVKRRAPWALGQYRVEGTA